MGIDRRSIGCKCCGSKSCNLCVSVYDCYGSPVPGAYVDIYKTGGSHYNCTTGSNGACCISVPSSGNYNISVSKSGYTGWSGNANITCPNQVNVNALIYNVGNPKAIIDLYYCPNCNCLQLDCSTNPIININGGSYTFNGPSCTYFSTYLPPGTYTYTITATRFQTYTGSITVPNNCFGVGQNACMVPATGYQCSCYIGIPLSTTLFLVDSVYGNCTLTYSGGSNWTGGKIVNFGGGGINCGCPTANGISIKYTLSGCPSATPTIGCGLRVDFDSHAYGDLFCPSEIAPVVNSAVLPTVTSVTPPPAYLLTASCPVCNNPGGLYETTLYPFGGTISITE